MHILAFNSSPRDHETSKTELVLQKFLEGAKRAGASRSRPCICGTSRSTTAWGVTTAG